MQLTYVTGNIGKYYSVKERFAKHNIPVNFYTHDFAESNVNDIEVISRAKVTEAYQILNSPCFVADSGFYIKNYPGNPGYPGAFAKRSGVTENIDELLKTLANVEDRSACFKDCVTFYDGNEYYTFYGISYGTIAYEKRGTNVKKAKSKLWSVFIPQNHTKTLAEMTDEERNNRHDNATSAYEEFVTWYQEVYSQQKNLKK